MGCEIFEEFPLDPGGVIRSIFLAFPESSGVPQAKVFATDEIVVRRACVPREEAPPTVSFYDAGPFASPGVGPSTFAISC